MSGIELTLAAALLAPAQSNVTGTITINAQDATVLYGGISSRRPVDEQIEVMRALLLRKLGRESAAPQSYSWDYPKSNQRLTTLWEGAAQTASSAPYDAYQMASYFRPTVLHGLAVEGTYLDGYGAVFTVTMDATGRDPRPKTDGDKPAAPLTDWDRAQRALRGEPIPDKPAGAAKETPVSDVLLKLLADNGKHFTALKDDERLTVAVTFRGTGHSTAVTTTTSGQNKLADTANYYGSTTYAEAKEDRIATMTNLGDLHLKQGQPDRAIEAYTKALGVAVTEAEDSGKPDDQRVSATALKLANAYLAAGKEDEARAAMDRAKAAREKPAVTKTANKTAAAPLPARLTVSAPKKLLDQVGSGKITFDEFRKQATVEYVPAGK